MRWYTLTFPGKFKFVQATSLTEAAAIAMERWGMAPLRVREMTPGTEPIAGI